MSEEEKESIQELKVLIGLEEYNKLSYKENQAINIALNLIDKQQKEIEELQKYMKTNLIPRSTINLLYISKDKIKKILGIDEELEKDIGEYDEEKILTLLQTIVAEFNRLEDIEDRKVQVAVDNIEKKRDKYWKDKIREAISTPYSEIAIDNLLKLLEK